MRWRNVSLAVLPLVVLLAACGTPEPTATPRSVTTPDVATPTPGAAATPDAMPAATPDRHAVRRADADSRPRRLRG